MGDGKDYRAVPSWYYVPDYMGVPDGKRMLASVDCSCGQRMNHVDTDYGDCCACYYYECPRGHAGYRWCDCVEEC